jgi:hypothetical protein
MRQGHTPISHQKHTADRPCGCSTEKETDVLICKCGAAYTNEALSFVVWNCYDCGRKMLIRFL